jgi:hypothetical protein
MTDAEIKEILGPKEKASPMDAQELKVFFRDRGISYAKLGKVLGVTRAAVGHFLNARSAPVTRLNQLKELRVKVERWELESGERFGSLPK